MAELIDTFTRDIALTATANLAVDVLVNNAEGDFAKVPIDRVRVISRILLIGTAGNTTGRGIELYEGKDRKHFQNDYKETALTNFNDKAEPINAAFRPGSQIVLIIQSGATPASGRLKAEFMDFKA